MPSVPAIAAANVEQTDEVWLAILEITHSSLAQPIRVVNNNENVTSNGNVYLAAAFKLTQPDDTEHLPQVMLEVENVDRAIVDAVRAITSPPTFTLSIVLASSPNTIEAGPYSFTMTDANYTAEVVRGTLTYEDMLNEPFPGEAFDPSRFPGLF